MGIASLYQDFQIDTAPQGHRRYRSNWVNTHCPFCGGSKGYHLGYNLHGNYYHCYRCGFHAVQPTLTALLGVTPTETQSLLTTYRIASHQAAPVAKPKNDRIHLVEFAYPTQTGPLQRADKRYLAERGFHPERLQRDYGLLATGPVSRLVNTVKGKKEVIDFRHRILFPIYWRGQLVSFQGRDRTGKQTIKYLTCPMYAEVLHHKYILFCKNGQLPEKIGICVEGVFDVARLGPLSFATFGTSYTQEQMQLMAREFKRVMVWFDPEPEAQAKAHKLSDELRFRGVETDIVEASKDPADLTQKEANYIVKQLI